jgi:hypothetical protein
VLWTVQYRARDSGFVIRRRRTICEAGNRGTCGASAIRHGHEFLPFFFQPFFSFFGAVLVRLQLLLAIAIPTSGG